MTYHVLETKLHLIHNLRKIEGMLENPTNLFLSL